jgi:hypothetical protein
VPILDKVRAAIDTSQFTREALEENIRLHNYDVDKAVIALMEMKKQTTSSIAGTVSSSIYNFIFSN